MRQLPYARGRRREGTVGPNLDEKKPSAELVIDRVTNGKGVMPAFEGKLTEQQIEEIAAYVSAVAGACYGSRLPVDFAARRGVRAAEGARLEIA